MFLAPDGEEIEIANAAAAFLASAIPIDRLHAKSVQPDLSPTARRGLADKGWFALALGEEVGGSGLSSSSTETFHLAITKSSSLS